LQIHTAVRFTVAAGDAGPAIEIRLDRAAVARFYGRHGTAHRNNFDAKFVTEDSWVIEKGLVSDEGVYVSAADPDASNPHQRVPWLDRVGKRRRFD
jgi:hypothetical protein